MPFALAQALIQAARERVDSQQAEIEQERHEKLSSAWASGFQEGLSELHLVAEKLRSTENLIFEQMKPQLLRLVFSLAEEVLGEALAARPEAISPRLEAALRNMQRESSVRVQLHPEDLSLISKVCTNLCEEKAFSLQADANMPRGAIRITSPTGCCDLNPSEHLERLERHIISNRLTDCVLSAPPDEVSRSTSNGN